MGAVRLKHLLAIAAGLLVLAGGGAGPVLAARPHGARGAARARAVGSRAGARTVGATLARLLSSGAIAEGAYRQYSSAYSSATSSLGRLSGTRAAELGAVLANLQSIAAA